MKIRPATKKDAQAISHLLVTLTQKFIAPEPSKVGSTNILESMQAEAIDSYFDQGFRYHVGEIGEELVGVIAIRENSHLHHLFVKESEQGNGYSKLLWDLAKAKCIAAGNTDGFTVNSSLNSQGVYKGWGFIPTEGIREGNGIKAIPMKLVLNS